MTRNFVGGSRLPTGVVSVPDSRRHIIRAGPSNLRSHSDENTVRSSRYSVSYVLFNAVRSPNMILSRSLSTWTPALASCKG